MGFFSGEVVRAPGILAKGAPLQVKSDLNERKWKVDDFVFTSLASFTARARVLSKTNYRFDPAAVLSPVDFALGWNSMSDNNVLDKISISQRSRYYKWSVMEFPIPRKEIVESSANMHIIPANEKVRKNIGKVKKGSLVYIRGKLVEVNRADGWRWKSSLTRSDTGQGACEVIWVEELRVSNN